MNTALLITAVIGAVELVKRVFEGDWRSVAIITTAAATGALLGPVVDVTWLVGLVGGLGASGAVEGIKHAGTKGY